MTPAAAAAASKDNTEALMTALHARTETEVASGEALNHILAAIVAAEAKGGKGVSAFLPPQVLGEVRFAGKTGEVLNLLRQAGHLPFPAAFETPELRPMRDAIERDISALAAPMLLGKPYEAGKLAVLEADLKKAELASPIVIREQSFEDAIATRRFLNQLAGLTRTLRGRNDGSFESGLGHGRRERGRPRQTHGEVQDSIRALGGRGRTVVPRGPSRFDDLSIRADTAEEGAIVVRKGSSPRCI